MHDIYISTKVAYEPLFLRRLQFVLISQMRRSFEVKEKWILMFRDEL